MQCMVSELLEVRILVSRDYNVLIAMVQVMVIRDVLLHLMQPVELLIPNLSIGVTRT